MSGTLSPLSVDTSIPLQAGKLPERSNPFQGINQFSEAWRGINAAKSSNVSLAQQTRQAAYSAMLPMLALPPEKWTMAEMTTMAARAERAGVSMQGFLADLGAHGGGDGKPLADYMRMRIMPYSQTDAGAALAQVQGPFRETESGQERFFGRADPVSGAFRPANSLPLTLGPETATQPVEWTVADERQARILGQPVGAKIVINRAQQARLLGGGAAAGPAGQPGGSPAAGGRGGIPAGAGGYPAPSIPSLATPPTTNPVDIEAFSKDQATIPDRQRAVQTLDKALKASTLAASGKGAANINQMRQFLATMTPSWANSLGFKPFEVANMNYDTMNKYLTDYSRGVAVGGTDMARAQAEASNASVHISPEAARDVIRTNIGRERQDIAKTLTSPNQSLFYTKHAAEFAGGTDPRAFAVDHMTKKELQDMIKAMSPEELARFDRSLSYAAKHKLISVPGGR
jgi:hypothetical protein